MNWVRRRGASRKSSALRRRRRVEDEQVVAVLGPDLEQLLHRHVLLRARERAPRAAGRCGWRGSGRASRRPGRGGARPRRRSPSRRASSPTARRPPGRRPPAVEQRRVDLALGVAELRAGPSESASRLAGSIVSTATFLPRAAIPAAIAADVVVLPTPPEPAQMQHASCPRAARRPRPSGDLGGELADLLEPQLRLEDEGQRGHGSAGHLLESGQLLALGRRRVGYWRTAARAGGGGPRPRRRDSALERRRPPRLENRSG